MNGRPIHVSDTEYSRALVAVGAAPYYEELEKTSMEMAYDFLHECADFRRSGSAAMDLAYLACGRHGNTDVIRNAGNLDRQFHHGLIILAHGL